MSKVQEHIRTDLRQKFPGKARDADHRRSRTAAIHLACLDCCCGQRSEVRNCPISGCFLWPYRPYGPKERGEEVVPTEAEYEELLAARGRGSGEGEDG